MGEYDDLSGDNAAEQPAGNPGGDLAPTEAPLTPAEPTGDEGDGEPTEGTEPNPADALPGAGNDTQAPAEGDAPVGDGGGDSASTPLTADEPVDGVEPSDLGAGRLHPPFATDALADVAKDPEAHAKADEEAQKQLDEQHKANVEEHNRLAPPHAQIREDEGL